MDINNIEFIEDNNVAELIWTEENDTENGPSTKETGKILNEEVTIADVSSSAQTSAKLPIKLKRKIYKCCYCPYNSKRMSNIQRHFSHVHRLQEVRIITGEEFYTPPIPPKEKTKPANEDTLILPKSRRVIRRNPANGTKKFPCPNNCGSSYKNIRSLRGHCKFECGQGPRFKCPYCNFLSKYSRNIISHVKFLHPQNDVYSIDVITKKTFGNIKKLTPSNKQQKVVYTLKK